MQHLNLPEINCNIRKNEGKIEIFDIIRKKYIKLLPEEWVRQHVVHYLINELKYPKSLIKVESGLSYNKLEKRTDILVYNSSGICEMLVECKSFKVKISQSAFDQLAVYNTSFQSKYLLITNGINHFCCLRNEDGKYSFLDNIPEYKK
ncbi:type I restriction enzyme HsdR N-terminal domain-containing protein [Fulvivirga sp.]|uniref:type I restriction enzyme HsdR N-terminal domain-containing protein n=1 Tax=Fulvivirga sp. TaxID=1931237 RepID=UPI0032EC56B5